MINVPVAPPRKPQKYETWCFTKYGVDSLAWPKHTGADRALRFRVSVNQISRETLLNFECSVNQPLLKPC